MNCRQVLKNTKSMKSNWNENNFRGDVFQKQLLNQLQGSLHKPTIDRWATHVNSINLGEIYVISAFWVASHLAQVALTQVAAKEEFQRVLQADWQCKGLVAILNDVNSMSVAPVVWTGWCETRGSSNNHASILRKCDFLVYKPPLTSLS